MVTCVGKAYDVCFSQSVDTNFAIRPWTNGCTIQSLHVNWLVATYW